MATVLTAVQEEPRESFQAGLASTGYGAYRLAGPMEQEDRAALAQEVEAAIGEGGQVQVRGAYDTSGMRAEADLMLWLAAPAVEDLQAANARLRRTRLGRMLVPFWQAVGVHREAEFSKSHKPAFFDGEPAREWLCVYPFVRTPEWYLLEPERRRALLVEHGRMGRSFPDVRANTVSAFGLGDYEWLLAFEADDLGRIVDLIRHLRGSEARLYTKNELPFITGLRRPLAAILQDLP